MNRLKIEGNITIFDGCLNTNKKEKSKYLGSPLVAPIESIINNWCNKVMNFTNQHKVMNISN